MNSEIRKAEVIGTDDRRNIWMRGLWMVVFAVLFEVGRVVLWVLAAVQFVWMLVNREKNQPIADFGAELGRWQMQASRYLTARTEARPFPFAKWGEVDQPDS